MGLFNQLNRYLRFSSGFLAGFLAFSAIYYIRGKSIFTLKQKRRVAVFFGDSITQRGFEIDRRGYLASMAEWWKRKVDIFNRGYSGYNSAWGKYIIDENVLSLNPDLVVIFFGANDSIDAKVAQYVPLDEYSNNIEEMIRKVLNVSLNFVIF